MLGPVISWERDGKAQLCRLVRSEQTGGLTRSGPIILAGK
jgi:hypothetical protein